MGVPTDESKRTKTGEVSSTNFCFKVSPRLRFNLFPDLRLNLGAKP